MQEKETVIPDTSDDEDRADIQIYAFDAKTISFLRFCGKCLVEELTKRVAAIALLKLTVKEKMKM